MTREELLFELSQGNGLTPIKAVNRLIRKDESILDLVIDEALNPSSPQGKNAAWTLEYMCRRKRRTVKPHIPVIIATIPELTDFRQQAILLHLLLRFKLHAETLGPILNFCIDSLRRIEEASYLPYYSMQLLGQVVKQEPELSREFQLAIEEAMPLYEKFYVKRMAKLTIAMCEKASEK
jgi:hypothetical protein